MGNGLTKTHGWEQRFATLLSQYNGCEFNYGTLDCCLFVGDVVKEITGVDLVSDFRGKYHDLESLRDFLQKKQGSTDHIKLIAKLLTSQGVNKQKPVFAKRGDVVVIRQINDNEINYILGIIHLNGKDVVAMQHSGLGYYPISMITKAWEIN